MPDCSSSRNNSFSHRAGVPLVALAWAMVAQAAPPRAQAPLRGVQAARVKALLSAEQGLSPEAAQARVTRLEKAWARAEAMGLLKTPSWRESRQEGRVATLGRAYLQARPGHLAMTEEQVRASFLAQGEERRVSHVLCKTPEAADAALKRLAAGEAFDAVASELSADPSAIKNRGDLGWIRQGQVVAAFGDPVFHAAIGTLVGPIKSEFGWHVAKVWEARRKTAGDFIQQRDALMKEAADAQWAMKRDAALAPLRTRYPLVPDLKVLGGDRTSAPLAGDEKKAAGRVAGMTISLGALKRHLFEVLKTMGQSHSLGAATKARFMEGLADQLRLAAAAQKQGLDRKPEVQAALWVDEHERASQAYAEAYLSSLKVGDEVLARHHRAHPDRFRAVGALRLQVLVAVSRDRVDEALNQLRMGMPWRAAVTRFADAEATGNPEPGWVEVASLKAMVPPTLLQPLLAGPLDLPVGPMLGPDGFMLFNVLERRPGPVLPLAECQDLVRADYLKAQGQALVDQSLEG